MVGRLTASGSKIIKGLTFDGHGAHNWFRSALMGVFDASVEEELGQTEWFWDLTWEDLPCHDLPRLPVKVCKHHGQVIWPLQGPMHAAKNVSGQLNSVLRTIHMGVYYCDSSAARAHGLPPCAYVRSEAMSDKLNCLLWNPYFSIQSPDA